MVAPGYHSVNLRKQADLVLLPKQEKKAAEKRKLNTEFYNNIISILQKKEEEISKCASSGKTKFKIYTKTYIQYPDFSVYNLYRILPVPGSNTSNRTLLSVITIPSNISTDTVTKLSQYIEQKFGDTTTFETKSGTLLCQWKLYLKW